MKKYFTLIFFLILFLNTNAQTQVSGEQSGTWTFANSPYEVTDTIIVPSGQTLTIEPGVTVNFQGNYRFHIRGKLIADGTEQDTILFTANNQTQGWGGLRFDSTLEISHLSYCKFTYGKTGGSNFPNQHGGAVMLDNSDIVIENCLFANNEATANDNGMGGAIYGFNTSSDTKILNCTFKNNHSYGEGGAVKLTGDNGADIENCTFLNNSVLYGGGAICLYGCYNTHIYKCLFAGNYTSYAAGGAAFLEGYSAGVMFVNCTMINNEAVGGDGGGVEIAFSDASFTNCIIYDNNGAYSDNIYLDFGYAEINYCNTPVPDDATGSNNFNSDAQFTDADNGDFHLSETSPCIDAGIDSLTITDAYNNQITVIDLDSSEYIGTAPDMGCYEYNPGAGIKDAYTDKIKIYPNPAGNFFFIENQNNIESITISDISGKVVKKPVINNNQIKVDVSNLMKGIYLISIKTGNKILTGKILKH